MHKQIVLYILLALTLALQVTAIATPHWTNAKSAPASGPPVNFNMGLWEACGGMPSVVQLKGIDACMDLPPNDSSVNFPRHALMACRVFAILGAVMVGLASYCVFAKQYSNCVLMMLIGGAVSSLISVVIWASKMNKKSVVPGKPKYGYSYYLALVGGIVGLLLAGYYRMEHHKSY